MQLNHLYAHLLERGRRKTINDGRIGLAPKTVRNVHVMLHSALHDAMRWGYLVRNVAEAADPPAARTPEQKVWSPQELGAFLDHVRDDRLYALWLLVATTGMRRAELAGLRWVDVDLEAARLSPRRPRVVVNYVVHESEPKTRMGKRSLALDPATVAALREHPELVSVYRQLYAGGANMRSDHARAIQQRLARVLSSTRLDHHPDAHELRHRRSAPTIETSSAQAQLF